ncbi:MAG: hypothetical protein R3B91_05995 [Planctomycetaceae bacterium]
MTVRQEQELLELTRKLRGDEETERVGQLSVERIPFRIDRLEFWRETEYERPDEGVVRTYAPGQVCGRERSGAAADKDSRRNGANHSQRSSSTWLTATSADRRAWKSRRATASVHRGEQSAGATLSRIDFQSLHRKQPRIRFPQSRQATYRIVIENRDSPPLEVTGMSAEGVDELVFSAWISSTLLYRRRNRRTRPVRHRPPSRTADVGLRADRIGLNNQQPLADGVRPSPFRWSDVINNPVVLTIVIRV